MNLQPTMKLKRSGQVVHLLQDGFRPTQEGSKRAVDKTGYYNVIIDGTNRIESVRIDSLVPLKD